MNQRNRKINHIVKYSFFAIGVMLVFSSCNRTEKSDTKIVVNTLTEVVDESVMPYDTFSFSKYDLTASYLSGVMPEDSMSAGISAFTTSYWKSFSKRFIKQWAAYDSVNLNKIRQWTSENILYTDTVFYPFSGPDFNYLNVFFPDVSYSVMIGLEGVGSVPDYEAMIDDSAKVMLNEVDRSLFFNLKCSFFRTFSMEDELSSNLLDGTIPLILLFLKSHDYEIVNLYPVWINDKGILESDTTGQMYSHNINKDFDYAASFIYRKPGDTVLRELVYMSLDLSDKGIIAGNSEKFLKTYISGNTVFMKAASYLCHRPRFSDVRDIILNNASQIISDPSGINFDDYNSDWDLSVYGTYVGPIALFETRVQDNLITYCKEHNNPNLPFRFGYHPTHWCLIDAHRK
jgi:hypothetical protein